MPTITPPCLPPQINSTGALKASPPVSPKIPYTLRHHNHSRRDDYYWMRDDTRSNPEVLAHLEAENHYADAILAVQKTLQETLLEELTARIVKDDNTVPCQDGQYWYHSEISGEQEYERYYRATSASGENKQLLLDVNERAKDHDFYELGEFTVSPNEHVMSLSEDIDSRRIYSIFFKNILDNGQVDNYLDDVLTETEGQIVWANDNNSVFYVKKDVDTLLGTQVFRHTLGTPQEEDVLVYQLADHRFYLSLGKSRDDSTIFIYLEATESSDCLYLDANKVDGKFKPLIPYQAYHEYGVDKLADSYYFVTNWQAKNFRLMKVACEQVHDMHAWQEVIPHRDDVLLEGVELFNQCIVMTEREKGQIRFNLYWLNTSENPRQCPLTFDDPCYFACLDENPDPKSTRVRVYYSSLTTPASLYEFDLLTGQRTLLKQHKVLGGFVAQNYHCERLFVVARDGVEVPVSLVYRKDRFKKDGTNPLLQYGYGAYGITMDPCFSEQSLSLLDRGFVCAIAHVRGSEMLGRSWYEQGKKHAKQNTFNDFVDVTTSLVTQGYCARDKVFASGGSAGGLLMGAIANQAPQLYLGIGAHVPFLDVLTTMLDETIPLTTNEYDEWGNPNEKSDYDTILAYSPYDNIRAQDYPHILVTTGLHDSQVQYFEPMKWVAKLREYKTDHNLLLLKTDMDAGHGGASGRFKSLKDKALEMAFFIALLDKQISA